MIRQSRLLNIAVLDNSDKAVLGKVRHFYCDLATPDLLGFTYTAQDLLRSKRFVPRQYIAQLCEDFVLIRKPNRRCRRPKQFVELKDRSEVVDVAGNPLGFLADFYIDPEHKTVMALDVSEGFFEDLYDGRIVCVAFSRMAYSGKIIARVDERSEEVGY